MSSDTMPDNTVLPTETIATLGPSPVAAASHRVDDDCGGAEGESARWQFLYTVGVSFTIVALQMAQGVLLARMLGPEGRGQYATAVMYAQTLLYIGLFGGLEVICRHAAKPSIDKIKLRRSALWLGITTGLVTSAIACLLSVAALPPQKQFLMPLAVLCSLSIVGQHVMLVMTAVDRGSGQFTAYNIRRLISCSAFPVLLLVTACVWHINLVITCVLFVVASIISMVSCLVGLPHPFRGPTTAASVPQLVRESRPYGLSTLATELFDRFDLLLVLWLAPLMQQGYYAAMVPVVYPLTVIPNTLGMFLFNAGARLDSRLGTRDVHRILGSSIAVQVTSTVAFLLIAGPLVTFLYGQEFAPAMAFVLWLAPVSAIKGILQGLDAYLKGRGRPLAPLRIRIASGIVIALVTWLLFDRFGAVSIAMAALAGQLFCLAGFSWIVYADVKDTSFDDQPRGTMS
jgi:O-antigen/teichoic acid export membrane protein